MDLVLDVPAEEREPPLAVEGRLRREPHEALRPVAQEPLEIAESEDAEAEGRVHHVVDVTLGHPAGLDQVPPRRVGEPVFGADDVLLQAEVGRGLGAEAAGNAPDVDAADEPAAGHEGGERRLEVGFHVLAHARAAPPQARGVQRCRRGDVAVLAGHELVGGDEGARKLREVGGQVLLRVVERVAHEDLVLRADVLVEPRLHEVLVQRLVEDEVVHRETPAEVRPVGDGEGGQVRRHCGIDGHRAHAGQGATARVVVGHDGRDGAAEPVPQPLEAYEDERPVVADRRAERGAELVAREVGLRRGIEVVARVEGVVAMVEVAAAVALVGARFRDRVDLPSGAAAELGSVGIGLDPELPDRLGAERGARRASGRPVGEVVERRPVQQVHVGPRVLAVDAHGQPVGDHRASVAMRVGDDAGLQERQVGVVAAVQRQVADRLLAHEIAELAGARLHERRLRGDGDDLIGSPRVEGCIDDAGLADDEIDAAPHHGPEPGELDVDLPRPQGKARHQVAAVAGRRCGADEAGVDVARADEGARENGAGGIAHDTGELRRRGLRPRERGRGEDQREHAGKSDKAHGDAHSNDPARGTSLS